MDEKEKEVAWTKKTGKIPAYLQRYREEEANEKAITKYEIMMNKGKTDTTRTITKEEHERVLEDLYARKQYLDDGI